MTKQTIVLLATVFLNATTSLAAEPPRQHIIGSTGNTHVQLVELFSSEGCSSCPPADQWMSKLKESPDLWKSFVPVAFHVDYWNNLGWKDELSSEKMTARQVDLSKLWQDPSVYTPALVLDGKEWKNWRFAQSPPASKLPGPPLTLIQEADGSYTVKITQNGNSKNLILRAALLAMDYSSHVTRGENSGRDLKHNFAVINWNEKKIGLSTQEANFKLTVPENFANKIPKLAVVAWLEEQGNPTPLQAVGGYL